MSWDWEKLKKQQENRDGGSIPPQVDEIVKKVQGFKFPGFTLIILLIIAIYLGFSMFYTVKVEEVGVVQRFGKFMRTTQPGLHLKWPIPVENVTKVKVRRVLKEEFGYQSSRGTDSQRFGSDTEAASIALMLTGDLNVGVVPWIVQYKIKDPYNYLFKVEDVRKLLRDMSEAAMRQVVGDRSINEVISKRDEIAVEAKTVLQAELDNAESGIFISTIEMKKTNVPGPVQNSFNEVNQAVQEKEQMIYRAREEYNKAIPTARGEADRTIKAAEGYALDRVNRAKGDAARFEALYTEYAKAKDVTKRRIYLEKLKDVLPKLGQKYIVDAGQKNLLPLLNLSKQIEIGGAK